MSALQRATACLSKQAGLEGLNAFISRTDEGAILAAARAADERSRNGRNQSPIDGQLVAVKDNICTSASATTCASNILHNYRSPYAASAVSKLEAAGAIVVGKTNLDEFGMGSHSMYSASGPVSNSLVSSRGTLSAGGSSGGSAVAVASGQCHAALGTDTGGSVRLPASYCGVVGFKPSYGRLSRYGVVAYANSLDTVGILAPTTSAAKSLYETLDGFDANDPTSLNDQSRNRIRKVLEGREAVDKFRIGVPLEYNVQELDEPVRDTWIAVLQSLAARGHSIVPVSLPSTQLALAAYYILAPAEASSNLAKYDGVRYGQPADHAAIAAQPSDHVLYARTRGAGLGGEVRRRILLGAYSLSASAIDNYFLQAQRVRRLVCHDFDRVLALPHALRRRDSRAPPARGGGRDAGDTGGVDVLLAPTAPSLPPTLSAIAEQTPLDAYRGDVLTVPASLAGLPAISVPAPPRLQNWSEPASVGIQVIGQFGDEDMVLRVGATIEEMADDSS